MIDFVHVNLNIKQFSFNIRYDQKLLLDTLKLRQKISNIEMNF